MRRALLSAFAVMAALLGCSERQAPEAAGRVRLVLKYGPLWGAPEPFRELLARFQQANPDVELVAEPMPNASDLAHQLFVTALEGGAADLDVLVVDVIWVAEFARAGWIADLSGAFPPARLRAELLPGAAEAVILGERTFAVPWYVDVGILYWRTDLVPRAPRTYHELRSLARAAMARSPGLAGFLWQGRQYEGLDCNAFEAIWGHGGETLREGRLVVDTPEGRAGVGWLRDLVASGVSPPSVTSAAEEDSRRRFQQGEAVFMRNWPYALGELEAQGSPVRGRVGIAPLPSEGGAPGPGALGGWQLAVSARSPPPRRAAAERLVAHLTSPDAGLVLALDYARNPARRALYEDPRLRAGAPRIAALLPMVERARPRPVSPYYQLVADALQGELSAALTGLRSPEEALRRAQRQADRIAGAAPP
ncbi:MAG TPA: ABC transporter substrate-binding protein [Anaeromyxobacteraceae bacterium]